MDWKSQLESLRQDLGPADPDPAEAPAAPAAEPAEKARLDVMLDRKGRKGKEATIVAGFTVSDDRVADIAATLKKRLGCGGSSRGGEILIQGDKRRQVAEILASMGLKNRVI